jgi:SagB-type dehydrogenase family enzyme
MDRWRFWNPSAGFFHHATRDVAFEPVGATNTARPAKRKRSDSIKRIPGAALTKLPSPAIANEFSSILLARRTWRRFAPGPITLADLSTMLYLTAGIQRWEHTENGPVALKTSPSGGATHPGELYVFALHVAGLDRGLYHYRADTNALELIRTGGKRSDVERYLPTQWWYGRAAVLVFFSAVFARSLWRYNYSRAYRALLIEAGHQCQTFCLTATALGLAPFCVMALADSVIERDLGLDGRTEAVLYVAGVGRRPPGMNWAPTPRDDGASWDWARKRLQGSGRSRNRLRGV